MAKKDNINKEGKNPKFKNGEEAVCILSNEKGYIVNSFKACVVKLDINQIKVILDSALSLDAVLYKPNKKRGFKPKDKILVTLRKDWTVTGTVFASKWFYIFHLYRTGELKVMFGDVLVTPGTKIISSRILRPGNLRDLPGQGKVFSGN